MKKIIKIWTLIVICISVALVTQICNTVPQINMYDKVEGIIESASYVRAEEFNNNSLYFQRFKIAYKEGDDWKNKDFDWTVVDSPVGKQTGQKINIYINKEDKTDITLEPVGDTAVTLTILYVLLILILWAYVFAMFFISQKKEKRLR